MFEMPQNDDESIDIDVSDFEDGDAPHPEGDPAVFDAEGLEGAETGLGRVIDPEALSSRGERAESTEALLEDLAENALGGDTEFAEALEGKEGLKADLIHLIKTKLAPELNNHLYSGGRSRVGMRASEAELRAFLAGEASKLMRTDADIERLLKSDLKLRLWLERKRDEDIRAMGSQRGVA